jgi:hypothetical protein
VFSKLPTSHRKTHDFEAEIVDLTELLNKVSDLGFHGSFEKKLVVLIGALHVQDHHGGRPTKL